MHPRRFYLVLSWSDRGTPFWTWTADPAFWRKHYAARGHLFGPVTPDGWGIDRIEAALRDCATKNGFLLDDPATWPVRKDGDDVQE